MVSREISTDGMTIGTILKKPLRAIFLNRKTINDRKYIQAYIDNIGERFIEEDEVLELNGEKNVD
jgi:hypothetical protein